MTYLPAFEAAVKEGQVYSIMGAYNRTNGEACCASPTLLQDILRDEWGFDGYVVSDCSAIRDIYKFHQLVKTPAEASALAVKNGMDLSCERCCEAFQPHLVDAVKLGLIAEAKLDEALTRLFTARFRLGMFDPDEMVPFASIPIEVNDSEQHRALALQAARESIVLLKNRDDFLPLSKDTRRIAVIGPNAGNDQVLLGNYNGTPSRSVNVLEGIRAAVSDRTEVLYARGCGVTSLSTKGFEEARSAAQSADVVIFVGGLSQMVEGEEGQREGSEDGKPSQGDRSELILPGVQEELLQLLYNTGKPVVLVLLNGSAVAVQWANVHLPAILEAWYPGEEGGTAVADVLFGDYNPAGRLPVTFYHMVEDLPPFEDYDMEGRTYRYFRGVALYSFGHGLSYTRFAYQNLNLSASTLSVGEGLTAQVEVTNTGQRAGDEVVQCYVSDLEASVPVPVRQLVGFKRIHLQPGETQTVSIEIEPRWLALLNQQNAWQIEPGGFLLTVGGRQPEPRDLDEPGPELLFTQFTVQ